MTIQKSSVHTTEKFRVERITPERAGEMQGRNTHNRGFRPHLAAKYARDMEQGNWRFTGEPIIIDANGVIVSGQHRLDAIITTRITQDILVVTGVEPDARNAVDTGKSRGAHDVLHLNWEKNSSTLASLARYSIAYRANPNALWRSKRTVTHADILTEVKSHPEYREFANRADNLRRTGVLSAGPWAMGMKLLSEVDPDDEYHFTGKMAEGTMLEAGSPILALRKRLADIRLSAEPLNYDPRDYCALIVRAWNAWRTGRTAYRLQVRSRSGEFPVPI